MAMETESLIFLLNCFVSDSVGTQKISAPVATIDDDDDDDLCQPEVLDWISQIECESKFSSLDT